MARAFKRLMDRLYLIYWRCRVVYVLLIAVIAAMRFEK
jgi:hypothetical protein